MEKTWKWNTERSPAYFFNFKKGVVIPFVSERNLLCPHPLPPEQQHPCHRSVLPSLSSSSSKDVLEPYLYTVTSPSYCQSGV